MKSLLCCVGIVLMLDGVSSVHGTDRVTIEGVTYERLEGRWHVYDPVGETWEVAAGLVSIQFREGIPQDEIDGWVAAMELNKRPGAPSARTYQLYRYARDRDPIVMLKEMMDSPLVQNAFLDTFLKFQGAPNDEFYPHQWGLRKINIERAWDITVGDPSITIAVIDGGAQYEHEDLAPTAWQNPGEVPGNGIDDDGDAAWYGAPLVDDMVGWDFVDDDNDPRPGQMRPPAWNLDDRHGTACAGIAGAARNNQKGISGVAPGCRIVHVRADTHDKAVEALEYCWNKGIDVVSMSWTTNETEDSLFTEQIHNAYAAGVILVASTGNLGCFPAYFPASHPKVIGVGATDSLDVRHGYSFCGPKLMAPSGGANLDFWVTDNEGTFGSPPIPLHDFNPTDCPCPSDNRKYYSGFGGTSASAPAVAGVAALVRSREPSLTVSEVRTRLFTAAIDISTPGFDDSTGYGRVDAYRSLTKWGTIAANTTWSGTVYVSGDVTVASGVTLTIAAGTIIYVATDDNEQAGSDQTRVEFIVEGTLLATGTSASPIIFESWVPATPSDWVGIRFNSLSAGALKHVQIRNAQLPVRSYVALTINECVFEDGVDGVQSYNNMLIRNTTIRDFTGSGVVWLAGNLELRKVEIHNADYGVRQSTATSTGTFLCRNSKFHDIAMRGIDCNWPTAGVTIGSTTVEDANDGIYLISQTSVAVDTCKVRDNDIGIYMLVTSGAAVRRCTIDNNTTTGVYLVQASCAMEADTLSNSPVGAHYYYGSLGLMSNSRVVYNALGLKCELTSGPTVRGTRIAYGGSGVLATDGSNPDLGHATGGTCGAGAQEGKNSIHNQTAHYVANFDPAVTVYAECNYWGSGGAPPANKFYGNVDRTPYRTSDPNPVPPIEPPPGPGDGPPDIPKIYALHENHPNPFNPVTTIGYDVPAPGGLVEIAIYDVNGRHIRTLVENQRPAGSHSVTWQGQDERGEPVASGVYFVRMTAGAFTQTRKVVLLK